MIITTATAAIRAPTAGPPGTTLVAQKFPKKTFPLMKRALRSEIVHIKVGEDLEDFGIHKDLLCHYSPYFKAAFKSGFEESTTGIMKLPQTKIVMFELFNCWLYTQSLWSENDARECWPSLDALVELYIFADMAKIPRFMNRIIDSLITISDTDRSLPVDDTWRYVWENTSQSSPLRRLIVDWIAWDMLDDHIDGLNKVLPAELLMSA